MLSTVPIFVVCHTQCALKMNEVRCITLVMELLTETDRSNVKCFIGSKKCYIFFKK